MGLSQSTFPTTLAGRPILVTLRHCNLFSYLKRADVHDTSLPCACYVPLMHLPIGKIAPQARPILREKSISSHTKFKASANEIEQTMSAPLQATVNEIQAVVPGKKPSLLRKKHKHTTTNAIRKPLDNILVNRHGQCCGIQITPENIGTHNYRTTHMHQNLLPFWDSKVWATEAPQYTYIHIPYYILYHIVH